MRVLLLLALVALPRGRGAQLEAAARNHDDVRIVGGEETTIEKYNYQVAIEDGGGGPGKMFCGGSILTEKWILSAAHCFASDPDPDDKRIRVGSSKLEEGGTLYEVAKIFYHSGYSESKLMNDVSLALLKEAIVFSAAAGPINLTPRSEQARPGSFVTTTGWGIEDYYDMDLTETIRMARIRIIHPDICTLAYSKDRVKFRDTMICGSVYKKDACSGDSGGALVTDKRVQVGIVSWGDQCAKYGKPGVYTDISHPDVHDFITNTMAANNAS